MLWAAGQKRESREARERLAELYVGVRDGSIGALIGTGQVKPHGDGLPDYARPEGAARRAMTRRGLAQLVSDFPAAVAGKPEFSN